MPGKLGIRVTDLATIIAAVIAWLLVHFNIWDTSRLARGVQLAAWAKSKWRLWRARSIPLRAHLATKETERDRSIVSVWMTESGNGP